MQEFPQKCHDIGIPTTMFKLRSITYIFGLSGLAITISSLAIIAMFVIEYKKRKLNRFLQGKRLFMEKARKNKSGHYIMLASVHFLVFATSNMLFNTAIILSNNVSTGYFSLSIIGPILETSAGFFNAMIHLKMKNPQSEAHNSSLLTKHSLRKSSTLENVILISGGFEPKTKNYLVKPIIHNNVSSRTTDFGIFIGDDDDDDEEEGHSYE